MQTKTIGFALSLAAIVSAGLLVAQGPGDGPRGRGRGKMPPPGQGLPGGVLDGPNVEQRLTNVLGLTAEQQNKVHTALDERRVLAQGQTSKVPDLRDQLAAAVRANDEGKIDQLTQELSRAQQQQLSLQAKTMAKIYAALTADQKSRFDASLDRQMGVRPRQGKGAPPPGAIR